MRSTILYSVLANLATTLVLAQNYRQSPPFYLKLSSTNESIDGQYLSACHAGAAIEGLCLGGTTPPAGGPTSYASIYYFNQSVYDNGDGTTTVSPTGPLVFNLPVTGPDGPFNESEAMTFVYSPASNVAVPQFFPGDSNAMWVAFDNVTDDGAMYLQSYYDDSTFVAGTYPNGTQVNNLYNWYACWTIVGGYYYHALTWVTAGAPHNPTCDAVQVVREWA